MKSLFILGILLLGLVVSQSQVSLDFHRTAATLNTDKTLTIRFRSTGGTNIYRYSFGELPYGWSASANAIHIPTFSPYHASKWSLKVEVSDTSGHYVQQTILLSFIGYYVSFTPITLPVRGIRQLAMINSPESSLTNSISPSTVNQVATKTQNKEGSSSVVSGGAESNSLNDLVGEYPGLQTNLKNTIDKQKGFAVNYGLESSFVPELIATTQSKYEPERDSYGSTSQLQVQQEAILRRQSNAKNMITNLLSSIQKMVLDRNKFAGQLASAQSSFTKFKAAVEECDSQIFELEDTRTKIKNALSDKQSRLGQFRTEIKNIEGLVILEENELKKIQNDKKQTEKTNLPYSQALIRLQNSLEDCQNSLQTQKTEVEQASLEIEETNKQIKLLKIQITQANRVIENLEKSLTQIKAKITNIEAILREARKQQAEILAQHKKYKFIPSENVGKIEALERKIEKLKRVTYRQQNCDIYSDRLQAVQKIVNKNEQKYQNLTSQIENKRIIIEQLKSSLNELKLSSNGLPLEIDVLTQQLNNYANDIRRKNYLCQDNRDQNVQAKALIEDLEEKINRLQVNLRQINSELEEARTEQEMANQAVIQFTNSTSSVNLARPPVFSSSGQTLTTSNPVLDNNGGKNIAISALQSTKSPQEYPSTSKPTLTTSTPTLTTSTPTLTTSTPTLTTSTPTLTSSSQNPSLQKIPLLPFSQIPTNNLNFEIPSENRQNLPPIIDQSSQIRQPSFSQGQSVSQQNIVDRQQTNSESISSSPAVINLTPVNLEPLSDDFTLQRSPSTNFVRVGDPRNYLSTIYGLDISLESGQYDQNLYTISSSVREQLVVSEASTTLGLSSFVCDDSFPLESSGSGIITDIGIGTIMVEGDNGMIYQLSISQCTKLASTSPNSSIRLGNRVYFKGAELFALSSSVLYNAYLIVSVVGSA